MARDLIMAPRMSPTKALFTIVLTFGLGVSAAHAGTITLAAGSCDHMLADLGSMQATLVDMEQAVADTQLRQQALIVEARTLATTIADKRANGAAEVEILPLVERRASVLAELEEIEKHLAMLEGQLEALVTEVDGAERGYIACIESTIQ